MPHHSKKYSARVLFHWLASHVCLSAVLCLCATTNVLANTYCVHDGFELSTALTDASTSGIANDRANIIHLASGTFVATGNAFNFHTASGFALTLDGGYDSTCTIQNLAPGLSMIDGGGTIQALSLQSNGTVIVRHVTIQNGVKNGSDGGGAQFYSPDPAAVFIFDDNVVRNNSSDYGVGGLMVFGAGLTHIDNNLFYGNSAPFGAALFVNFGTGSTAYLTNNTIAGNTSTGVGSATTSLGDASGSIAGYVNNTISFGNSATYDFFLYTDGSVQFTNNDYGSINGMPTAGSSGNVIGIDPKFVGAGDYHLMPTSPLYNIGTLAPAGGLPHTDLEGHPRRFANRVDLGAYQHGDGIFTDGFEQ